MRTKIEDFMNNFHTIQMQTPKLGRMIFLTAVPRTLAILHCKSLSSEMKNTIYHEERTILVVLSPTHF